MCRIVGEEIVIIISFRIDVKVGLPIAAAPLLWPVACGAKGG